jgi:hypothetical protein
MRECKGEMERVVAQFDSRGGGDARQIPFDFAQGRVSLRLKNGCARDDARYGCSAIRLNGRGDARQIRFDFAQSRLWLGLKNGYARDDGDESKGTLQASSRIAR